MSAFKVFSYRFFVGINSLPGLKGTKYTEYGRLFYQMRAESLQIPKYCRLSHPRVQWSEARFIIPRELNVLRNSPESGNVRNGRNQSMSNSGARLPPGGRQETQLHKCQSVPNSQRPFGFILLCSLTKSWAFLLHGSLMNHVEAVAAGEARCAIAIASPLALITDSTVGRLALGHIFFSCPLILLVTVVGLMCYFRSRSIRSLFKMSTLCMKHHI